MWPGKEPVPLTERVSVPEQLVEKVRCGKTSKSGSLLWKTTDKTKAGCR